MNELKKLNAIHKAIMTIIEGSSVLYVGSLTEGWNEYDHIQHTSDNLPGQIKIFERQLQNVFSYIENENTELIRKSLSMYKKDLSHLQHNIEYDKIDKRLFESVLYYVEQLKGLIDTLEDVLVDLENT